MKKILNVLKHPAFISLLIVILGTGGLYFLFSKDPNYAAYVERSWGKADAQIVIVEYADFQCPGCRAFSTTEKQLKENHSDQIKFIYKHFPIQGHNNARRAAQAAEAAGAQGKFWEYHDLLFSRQEAESLDWNTTKLVSYAQELGLDTTKFKKELTDRIYEKIVDDNAKEGLDRGVTGTPTIYINGKKVEYETIPTYEDMLREIESATGTKLAPTQTETTTPTVNPTATPEVTATPVESTPTTTPAQ